MKIFLKKKEIHWIFCASGSENCIWDTSHLWSRKYLLSRNLIIWFHASLSASLHTKIFIRVPHLFSSRQSLPMFYGHKKGAQPCKVLVPKTQKVVFLTFSSYSINILSNYLNSFNVASFLESVFGDLVLRLKNH